jgi:lysophospholipase
MPYQRVFIGKTSIRYRSCSAKGKRRGRLVIMSGLREFIEKYDDALRRFAAMGLEVVCFDWPGQGGNPRLTPCPYLVHSDGFDLHLKAAFKVLDAAGFIADDVPLFIFGHSMGGHLALRFGRDLQAKRGLTPKGVMLAAPMMMPPTFMPPRLILMLAAVICAFGFSRKPLPFRTDEAKDFSQGNKLTRDPEGYALQHHLIDQNPALRTTGPSFGWVRSAYSSCLATTGVRNWLRQCDFPVQVHLPGAEMIVATDYFDLCRNDLPRGEVFDYPEAKHELLLEYPEVRTAIWERLSGFINAQLSASI